MIAVTGANGQLGRLVLQALVDKGATNLRALVRTPKKAADLASEAVHLVEADYDRPETLATALQGVTRLVMISGSEVGKRMPQHTNVIEAAKAAGVSFIAYTSLLHAGHSPLAMAAEHKATEEMIAASGIAHAFLRNGWYLENYTGTVAAALQHGAVIGSSGEGVISAAGRKDYAEAAAAVIGGTDAVAGTFELAGQPGFTLGGLAAEISAQTGRDIPFHNLPEEAYADALKQAGLPPILAGLLADSDAKAAGGALQGAEDDLQRLTGHASESLEAFVARTLKQLG